MDTEPLHKAIVNRWFAEFLGEQSNLSIVDELASVDVVLEYSVLCSKHRHERSPDMPSGTRSGRYQS
jgi:hypothetical protein